MNKILKFFKKNLKYIIIVFIIVLIITFKKNKKEKFTNNNFKVEFNLNNPNLAVSYLIDYNDNIFKKELNKNYFLVPKGIYNHYIVSLQETNQNYLFPPKMLTDIKIDKNICLNNLYNNSNLSCTNKNNLVKLLESNKNINIEVYYEFKNKNGEIELKKFPYVEIIAFDNHNRTMITITDTQGNSKLKLLNEKNTYWSILYNLPTIEEVYEAVDNSQYGLSNYYEEYEGKRYFVYNIEKEGDKFIYKPYTEDGYFVTDNEILDYIRDNIDLPQEWKNNIKEYYGVDIKSKEDFIETINKLNDVYNSVNTLIKSDNFIYKNNKKLNLPINPANFNSSDKIKIVIPNVEKYIRLNYKIVISNLLNSKNIKISLYIKKEKKNNYEFYSVASDIKDDGSFYVFIEKALLENSQFKLMISSPNEYYHQHKIDNKNIIYFTVESINDKLKINYFEYDNKIIKSEIIEKEYTYKSADTENYFKYYLFNLNDKIEFVQNNYNLNIIFNLPENYSKNINDLNGTINATSKNGLYVFQKKFNFQNVTNNKLIIPIKLHFNNLKYWNINFTLDRKKAKEKRIYYKNISEKVINDEISEIEFYLEYLDKELVINSKNTEIKGNINIILKPEVTISNNDIHNIDHKITIIDGKSDKIFLLSNYKYLLSPTIDNNLLNDYLEPKDILIDFNVNKIELELLRKDREIQININNKNEYQEIYCNIHIDGIRINKNISETNKIKINNNLNKDITIKILGIKESDNIIYTYNYTGAIKNIFTIDLESSDFINFKQNCFQLNTDSSYLLQIIKNENMDIELEIPEKSLSNQSKKVFLFIRSAYYLIDNKISKFFVPINIEVKSIEGEKILRTVNKNIKMNFKYNCGIVKEGNKIKKIIKTGNLIINEFQNLMIKDNSKNVYKSLKNMEISDKNNMINEMEVTKESITYKFDMELVALMNNNRFTESINNNNSVQGLSMNESIIFENLKDDNNDQLKEFFGNITTKHVNSVKLQNRINVNLTGKNRMNLKYYIVNESITVENGLNSWRWGSKTSSKHEDWQENFIDQLFNQVSSFTETLWRRTYNMNESNIDIYQFDYDILPDETKSSIVGYAWVYGENNKSFLVNKHYSRTDDNNWSDWKNTMVHELGHALGLSHPHTPQCNYSNDCQKEDSNFGITIMSYINTYPMYYLAHGFSKIDIQELQNYWGKNEDNYTCPYDEGIFWMNNKSDRCYK